MKVRARARQWLHYGGDLLAPLCRRFAGSITPVIPWRHYAEDLVAPLRRRRIGSIMPAIHTSAGLAPDAAFGYDRKPFPTLFRHYKAVREFFGVQPYIGTDANEVTIRAAREAAETMDQQVDVINATIDALTLHQVELPAFSTLDNIAEQIHTLAGQPGHVPGRGQSES